MNENKQENGAEIDRVLEGINEEFAEDKTTFFGHEINAESCIAFVLTLRGKTRGQPPKILQRNQCNGFPEEREIIQAIKDHDDIEKKLAIRQAKSVNGIWFAECEFTYRESLATTETRSLSITVEVGLDQSGTSEAIGFIREARLIAEASEKATREEAEKRISLLEKQLTDQKTFFELALKTEREEHKLALAAERQSFADRLQFFEKELGFMRDILKAAVEAKSGISPTERQHADMMNKLLVVYEDALKKHAAGDSTGSGSDGFIATVERGISFLSAMTGAGEKVAKFMGSAAVPNVPLLPTGLPTG